MSSSNIPSEKLSTSSLQKIFESFAIPILATLAILLLIKLCTPSKKPCCQGGNHAQMHQSKGKVHNHGIVQDTGSSE